MEVDSSAGRLWSLAEACWMDWIWATVFAGGLFLSLGPQQKSHCSWECHGLCIMRTLHWSNLQSLQSHYHSLDAHCVIHLCSMRNNFCFDSVLNNIAQLSSYIGFSESNFPAFSCIYPNYLTLNCPYWIKASSLIHYYWCSSVMAHSYQDKTL